MANRTTNKDGGQPNSRLRVFYVELDGSDATIAEALRTVERMRRPADGQHSAKQISPSQKAPDKHFPDRQDPVETEVSAESQNGDDQTELELQDEPARQRRGQGPKKDRNAGIELVGDLDFIPEGKPALKAFFAEKAPRFDMDQTLVLCYYLQHILKLSTFSPGHILSGFKHVAKPVPVDLRKTIRNMKNDKAWLNFSEIENLRMTTEGDNRVEHELGQNQPEETEGK